MKALKLTGLTAAFVVIAAAAFLGYWYFAIYSSGSSALQRACEVAVLNQVYVPDSTHFLMSSVNPQPVEDYLRMLKIDMQGDDVVGATKQLTKAKSLASERLGEITVALTSENRMGVPLRGLATCTYSAAPGKPIGERTRSVVVTDMNTSRGGPRMSWRARFMHAWYASRQPITQSALPPEISPDAIHPAWNYDTVPMGDRQVPTVFATLQSTNVIALAPPYETPQTATLTLWTVPPYWQVNLRLERGQFDCSDKCMILVRFDGKPLSLLSSAQNVSGKPYLDFNSLGTVFADELQTAKKIEITLPVFGNGYVTADFNVGGFDVAKFGTAAAVGDR